MALEALTNVRELYQYTQFSADEQPRLKV